MGLSKRLAAAVFDPLASRPRLLLGALFALTGTGHLAAWSAGVGLAAAVSAGDATAVGSALTAWATAHPAYLAAVAGGVVVAASSR